MEKEQSNALGPAPQSKTEPDNFNEPQMEDAMGIAIPSIWASDGTSKGGDYNGKHGK